MKEKWFDIWISVYTNALSWTFFILSSIYLCDWNITVGIACFFYAYFINYLGHTFLHSEYTYYNMYSILHCHHHSHDAWWTYILNVISEMSMMTGFLMLPKYIFSAFFFHPLNFWINEWVLCFNAIVYTTVHYINYTYYKVNHYHTKHHENENTNYFPDFFDAIFDTKNKDTSKQEPLYHKLPNIIFALGLVLIMKTTYNSCSENNKQLWKEVAFYIWGAATLVLTLASVKVVKQKIDDQFVFTQSKDGI
jgi:hypothetical protein